MPKTIHEMLGEKPKATAGNVSASPMHEKREPVNGAIIPKLIGAVFTLLFLFMAVVFGALSFRTTP